MASDIYFAAPLFNSTERQRNLDCVTRLESKYTVFLPQRDGVLLSDLVRDGLKHYEAAQQVFRGDIAAIEASDAVIAVLDGRTIDEGVAFELGVAFALRKVCIGIKDDSRQLLSSGDNPMVLGCCTVVKDIDQALELLGSGRRCMRAAT